MLMIKNALIYTKKVSTKTRRYLIHLTVSIWVKSNSQSVPSPLA